MRIGRLSATISLIFVIGVLAIGGGVAALLGQGNESGQPQNSSRLSAISEEPKQVDSYEGPVLDLEYDDGWARNIPATVSGYPVRYIDTPKSRACTVVPRISLHTDRNSLDDFLENSPDIHSLLEEIRSLPGVPQDVGLTFTPRPFDQEEKTARDVAWNARRLQQGCGEPLEDHDNESVIDARGFAAFQNKDAGETDDHAQGVFITTPSGIGTGQGTGVSDWSAVLNNVVTDQNDFIQSGMWLKQNDLQIVWTDLENLLQPVEFQDVPYYASTQYQFSNTYTNSTWWLCAGNNSNIDEEYECQESSDTDGTYLKDHESTSVFFENANTNSDWDSGFPTTISATSAKSYRNGTGYNWTSEDRITADNCAGGGYPVSGAMGTTSLKNGGTGTWTMSGIPLAC